MNTTPSTDHTLMDSEHRALLAWAQEGIKHLREARAIEDALYALDTLRHLARSHFEHEHIEMRQAGYPEWIDHVRDHERLLHELSSLRQEVVRPLPEARSDGPKPLQERLAAWMHGHIASHDKRFARWLKGRHAGLGERNQGTADLGTAPHNA
jgi:hemerythrin-like metal-binding protein